MTKRVSAAKPDTARPPKLQPSAKPAPASKPPISHGAPEKFTYLLTPWQVERRTDGWYVRAYPAEAAKTAWSGPFRDLENACLSIARGQCRELADRHTRHIEQYRLTPKDPRYGLKPTTRLKRPRNGSVA